MKKILPAALAVVVFICHIPKLHAFKNNSSLQHGDSDFYFDDTISPSMRNLNSSTNVSDTFSGQTHPSSLGEKDKIDEENDKPEKSGNDKTIRKKLKNDPSFLEKLDMMGKLLQQLSSLVSYLNINKASPSKNENACTKAKADDETTIKNDTKAVTELSAGTYTDIDVDKTSDTSFKHSSGNTSCSNTEGDEGKDFHHPNGEIKINSSNVTLESMYQVQTTPEPYSYNESQSEKSIANKNESKPLYMKLFKDSIPKNEFVDEFINKPPKTDSKKDSEVISPVIKNNREYSRTFNQNSLNSSIFITKNETINNIKSPIFQKHINSTLNQGLNETGMSSTKNSIIQKKVPNNKDVKEKNGKFQSPAQQNHSRSGTGPHGKTNEKILNTNTIPVQNNVEAPILTPSKVPISKPLSRNYESTKAPTNVKRIPGTAHSDNTSSLLIPHKHNFNNNSKDNNVLIQREKALPLLAKNNTNETMYNHSRFSNKTLNDTSNGNGQTDVKNQFNYTKTSTPPDDSDDSKKLQSSNANNDFRKLQSKHHPDNGTENLESDSSKNDSEDPCCDGSDNDSKDLQLDDSDNDSEDMQSDDSDTDSDENSKSDSLSHDSETLKSENSNTDSEEFHSSNLSNDSKNSQFEDPDINSESLESDEPCNYLPSENLYKYSKNFQSRNLEKSSKNVGSGSSDNGSQNANDDSEDLQSDSSDHSSEILQSENLDTDSDEISESDSDLLSENQDNNPNNSKSGNLDDNSKSLESDEDSDGDLHSDASDNESENLQPDDCKFSDDSNKNTSLSKENNLEESSLNSVYDKEVDYLSTLDNFEEVTHNATTQLSQNSTFVETYNSTESLANFENENAHVKPYEVAKRYDSILEYIYRHSKNSMFTDIKKHNITIR